MLKALADVNGMFFTFFNGDHERKFESYMGTKKYQFLYITGGNYLGEETTVVTQDLETSVIQFTRLFNIGDVVHLSVDAQYKERQ